MKFANHVLMLLAGLLIGLMAFALLELVRAKPRGSPIELLPLPTQAPLRVHVSGAVVQPGLYLLRPGSIVQEALERAGGAQPDAQLEALNLAAPLHDGQQIYIPMIDENPPTPVLFQSPEQTATQKINVNTASALELEDLPGIGPSLAAKIIAYRQEHGPFVTVDDLLHVSGIGPVKLAQIKDLIIVR